VRGGCRGDAQRETVRDPRHQQWYEHESRLGLEPGRNHQGRMECGMPEEPARETGYQWRKSGNSTHIKYLSQLDWVRQRAGSCPHQKPHDERHICGEVKTLITFMIDEVAKKDTSGGPRGKLMWHGGSNVRVTCATEDTELLV
jgi:hypothetical protein